MSYHTSWKQRLYHGLPYPLKCGMATAYGMQQRRARYGSNFRETLEQLKTSQHWDAETIAQYEEEALTRFVRHALAGTPYYRDTPGYEDYDNRSSLTRLPILDKTTVAQQATSFYADDYPSSPHAWGHTSGTTGRALVFPISTTCFQREYAFRALHYSWGGIHLLDREPVAFCSGHPVTHRTGIARPFGPGTPRTTGS